MSTIERVAADVLAAHQLGDPQGGTATGSRCACSCGEVLRTPGDRDYVMTLGRRHTARALAEAGLIVPAPAPEPRADFADAWDEGWEACHAFMGRGIFPPRPNPYRKADQ